MKDYRQKQDKTPYALNLHLASGPYLGWVASIHILSRGEGLRLCSLPLPLLL